MQGKLNLSSLKASPRFAARLLIVQPYLTAYRLPVFAALADAYREVIVASSPSPAKSGYGQPDVAATAIARAVILPEVRLLGGRLLWQRGLLRLLLQSRPDKLLIAANPRFLSFWMALLLCRVLGISCYAYGQGFYDKPNPPWWLVATYKLLVGSANCYICYTQSGLDSLRRQGIAGALAVAENSLRLDALTTPSEKIGAELGVLYLGRLREGCQLNILIDALREARRQTGMALCLHVVGSGEFAATIKSGTSDCDWISWHGEIYDQEAVRSIARECRIGCHPGHAGLSVVHFMGLSLVPVVHDRLDLHMGPEPSYIVDGVNGRCFSYAEAETSLAAVLVSLFEGQDSPRLAVAAFASYLRLNDPSLAERLIDALQSH